MKYAALILLFVPITAVAAETTSAKKTAATSAGLPHCVNSAADIALVTDTQTANKKTEFKYDGYRKVLQADSDTELVARLAYAETLAANCPTQNAKVLPLIAKVIGNRVQARKGDVKSVVFQRDQFASSLNTYEEARYKDFLCPQNAELWSAALLSAKSSLDTTKSSSELPKDALNYYLYQHSERFKAPNWELKEATPKTVTDVGNCIRFFLNPRYK